MQLEQLKINNLLVIEDATIDFSEKLTVLSGETGAGKTVLTKSFDLLAGKSNQKNLIRVGAEEAYVESHWHLEKSEKEMVYPLLEGLLEMEDELVIARRITKKKTYALINGKSCSSNLLQTIFAHLLQMYGQDQQHSLQNNEQQRKLIDNNLKTEIFFQEYRKQRLLSKQIDTQLQEALDEQKNYEREKDLLEFENNQLQQLALQPGEAEELFQRLQEITLYKENAEKLVKSLAAFQSTQEILSTVKTDINSLQDLATENCFDTVVTNIESGLYRLEKLSNQWAFDPEEENKISERLGDIHDLSRKHGCKADELPLKQTLIEEKLTLTQQQEEKVLKLQKLLEEQQIKTSQAADILSQNRHKNLEPWLKTIHDQLKSVALEGAQIKVSFNQRKGDFFQKAGPTGFEDIELLFCSGPGLKWGKLTEVASGGERSRLMLLFNIAVEDNRVVVMDEPDTGIGGNTAHGIGQRIFDLSRKQQTVIISHLPQLAQKADKQFVVHKKMDANTTKTSIYSVDGENRVDELMRMSGYATDDQALRKRVKEALV